MKDLGNIDEILGCRVHVNHDLGLITMDQKKYTTGILAKYLDSTETTWLDTPADNKIVLTIAHGPTNETEKQAMATLPYREVIGSLLWLSLGTRPDITYAVSQVAKFSANPGPEHWKAVKRILRYLLGTTTLGITFYSQTDQEDEESPPTLTSMYPIGYVDSDYARSEDRRSVTGYIFYLSRGPISWQTRQQPSTALSTMEAEFMAACAASQECVWLIQILKEFGAYFTSPITLFEDNKACLDYSRNSTNHQRTKDISVRYHFIRELINDRVLKLEPIDTAENVADIFTKPLDKRIFQRLRALFMTVII